MFRYISRKCQTSKVVFFVVVLSVLGNNLGVHGETDEDVLKTLPPPCPYNCTLPYRPLCGSDGKTYGNICHLNTKNRCDNTRIRKVRDGTCPQQHCVPDPHPLTCGCPCRLKCTNIPMYVCGTNGVTYRNACQLASRTACLGYPVRVCHKGTCSFSAITADPEADE